MVADASIGQACLQNDSPFGRFVAPTTATQTTVAWEEVWKVLLSMTGFGSARHESEGIHTAVEIRSVNHRYFKLVLRANEPYHLLEPEIEQAVRQYVRRGTVQVQLQVVKQPSASDYLLNRVAVRRYYEQLRELHRELGLDGEPELEDVLVLPGVASSAESMLLSPRVDWAVIQPALEQALHHLQQSRRREGEALAGACTANIGRTGIEHAAGRSASGSRHFRRPSRHRRGAGAFGEPSRSVLAHSGRS